MALSDGLFGGAIIRDGGLSSYQIENYPEAIISNEDFIRSMRRQQQYEDRYQALFNAVTPNGEIKCIREELQSEIDNWLEGVW